VYGIGRLRLKIACSILGGGHGLDTAQKQYAPGVSEVLAAWGFRIDKTKGFNWVTLNHGCEGLYTGKGKHAFRTSEDCLDRDARKSACHTGQMYPQV